MVGELRPQRLQLGGQLLAALHRECRADPDVLQDAFGVVQTEQHRADDRAALVEAVPRHHTVGGPLVLDLVHDADVRAVRQIQRLGDDTVEPGTLVPFEPLLGDGRVGGRGGEMDGGRGTGQRRFQHGSAVRLPGGEQRVVAHREDVEDDQTGRGLLGEQPHP